MKRLKWSGVCLLFLTLLLQACNVKNENTEDQKALSKKRKVTIQHVEKGIRANIDQMTKDGNGFFHFKNDTIELNLKLVRVHTEYLSVLGPNEFFACVDLATENGDVYDMDFFLLGDPDNMKVTQTTLHKLNGKPYYTWKQNKKNKTWFTVPVRNASNELLGVVEGTDKFSFTYSLELPSLEGESEVWIPMAQSDDWQTIEIIDIKAPTEYETLKKDEYGNEILYMKLNSEHSNKIVSIEYEVIRTEKAPYEEPNADLLKYLKGTELIPVGDRFSTIANEVINQKQANSSLTKARALYDYIIDNMRYAKQGVYGTGDANYACDSKSGNCTEFHSFFISLARSAGIPARFAVGAAIPSERNEGDVDGYHCWAEFYAEGKWWPVDISEANKYTPLATYYFGHHPANRIEFTRGRDLSPDPLPQSGPINFLAYPVLEINGEIEFCKTTFSFKRTGEAI